MVEARAGQDTSTCVPPKLGNAILTIKNAKKMGRFTLQFKSLAKRLLSLKLKTYDFTSDKTFFSHLKMLEVSSIQYLQSN